MPADTRAAVNAMVQDNGAPADEVTWGPYSGTTVEEDDWMDVDEDEAGEVGVEEADRRRGKAKVSNGLQLGLDLTVDSAHLFARPFPSHVPCPQQRP